jgi:hypothetical protein
MWEITLYELFCGWSLAHGLLGLCWRLSTHDSRLSLLIGAGTKARRGEIRPFLIGCARESRTPNYERGSEDIKDTPMYSAIAKTSKFSVNYMPL